MRPLFIDIPPVSPTSPSEPSSSEPETRNHSADGAKKPVPLIEKEKKHPVEKEKRPSVEKEKRPSVEFGPLDKRHKVPQAAAAKKAPAAAPRKRTYNDADVKAQGMGRRTMIYAAVAVLGASTMTFSVFDRMILGD